MSLETARSVLRSFKGIALLVFVNFFLILSLWVALPFSKVDPIGSFAVAFFAVPLTTVLLFRAAWKAAVRKNAEISKSDVFEDITYTLLMLEAGGFYGALFLDWCLNTLMGHPPPGAPLTFYFGGLAVCGGIFALGLRNYRRFLKA